MTTATTKVEVNCETGEVKEIPLTADEIAELEKLRADAERQEAEFKAQAEAKAEAKASALAKLAALGLTEEEANALIS